MPALHEVRQDLATFEGLLNTAERLHTHGVPFDDLRALGRLYRRHATRLARLRARDDDREAIRHLNALCVRAHAVLYAGARTAATRPALLAELPHVLARTWPAQVLAWALLLTGLVAGGALAWRHPDVLPLFVPAAMGYPPDHLDRLVASPTARAKFLEQAETPASWNAVFGSYLFTHNTRVGLLAFATGMLAGVPTIVLQVYNGLVLGAFASIFLHDPCPLPFWAWILPHAIPELTAISLCAAGGLMLGAAVAAPGRRGWRRAVADAVNPAVLLFMAAVPLLAVAAAIESFVRQSALGTSSRLGIAAAMAVLLLAAFRAMHRLARRYAVDTGWLRELSAPGRSGTPGSGSTPVPSGAPAPDRASALRHGAGSPMPPRVRSADR